MELLVLYQKAKLYVASPPITFSVKKMTRSRVSLRLQFWREIELLYPGHKKPPRKYSIIVTTRKIGDVLELKYDDKKYSIHIENIHKELPHCDPEAANRNYVLLRLVETPLTKETANV